MVILPLRSCGKGAMRTERSGVSGTITRRLTPRKGDIGALKAPGGPGVLLKEFG